MAYSLLIADDEREIRKGLCAYLPWKKLGFDLRAQAENGQQVLDVLQQQPIDVVLCDICMPVMTGLEAAREIHAQKLETTVVLYTAFRDFDYAQAAMSYGVRYYLLKSTPYREMLSFFETLKATLDEKTLAADRQTEVADADTGYYPSMLKAIKQYIEADLSGATLEGAAQAIGKSASFTSRFFREQVGMPFGDHLQSRRMEYALRLLGDPRLKTYEISELVGYATPKSFSRTFRQFYGVSPQEYRRGRQAFEAGQEV